MLHPITIIITLTNIICVISIAIIIITIVVVCRQL